MSGRQSIGVCVHVYEWQAEHRSTQKLMYIRIFEMGLLFAPAYPGLAGLHDGQPASSIPFAHFARMDLGPLHDFC